MQEIDIKNNEVDNAEQSRNFWAGDRVFLTALLAYAAVMFLIAGLRVVSALGWLDSLSAHASDVAWSVISQVFIMLLVPLVVMKLASRQSFKKTAVDFGYGRTTGKVIGYAFILGILLYVFNIFVAGVSTAILTFIGFRFASGASSFDVGLSGFAISIILVGVLPGVCEECAHRGLLLQSFAGKLGTWRAVLFSSLLFGLMHMNIYQTFYTMVLGYLIALSVLATRSIWTGVIMHFCNNAIGTYLQFAQNNNWPFGNIMQPLLNLVTQPFGVIMFFLFFYLVYLMIMSIIHRFAKENYIKNEKLYFVRFLKANPGFIKARQERGQSISLDDMSASVRSYLAGLRKKDVIRFYLDRQEPRQKMSVAEKTVLSGIIMFGALVTVFTFVWGML